MLRLPRSFLLPSSARCYAQSAPSSTVKLVSEIRKLTNAPIIKARQALKESDNDLQKALKWLENDLAVSGAAKAAKISGRTAGEGLISVSVLDGGRGSRVGSGEGLVKAAMIELNCESDFVGRLDLFTKLADDIAYTVASTSKPSDKEAFKPEDLEEFMERPLLSTGDSGAPSVKKSIMDLIARTGENITLRRATSLCSVGNPSQQDKILRLGSFVHNTHSPSTTQGRVGAIALLSLASPRIVDLIANDAFLTDVERVERALARQIVGFDTRSVKSTEDDETALYNQPFLMFGGDQPVRQVLEEWKKQWEISEIDVDFARWELGGSVAASE